MKRTVRVLVPDLTHAALWAAFVASMLARPIVRALFD